MATSPGPSVRTRTAGEAVWFLGTLLTIKAGITEPGGQFSRILKLAGVSR